MEKAEQLLRREDGSEVKIVAQACYGSGLKRSVDVYVLARESSSHDWRVACDRPHPDWRTMSVSEYIKRGRSEKLQLVSHGEIFKVANLLNPRMQRAQAN